VYIPSAVCIALFFSRKLERELPQRLMFPTASNSEMASYLRVSATTLTVSSVVVSKYEYRQLCPQDIYVFSLLFLFIRDFVFVFIPLRSISSRNGALELPSHRN
jgi:hypothetical protein